MNSAALALVPHPLDMEMDVQPVQRQAGAELCLGLGRAL